jgi:hypothetical protein
MNKEIIFNNEEYYFIITEKENYNYNMSLNLIDISIFEINEWKNILNMSMKFDNAIRFAAQASDYSYNLIDKEQKNAMYYLYYNCEFCNGNNKFTDLYNKIGNKSDYYELLESKIKNQKDNEKITINQFRLWIINNYDKINNYYNILK